MDFVTLKKVLTFSNIRKGFAKTCIIWPFTPMLLKVGLLFLNNYKGMKKTLFHQVKKKTMQPTTHYKKVKKSKTYLPLATNTMGMQ
jgi:hypothetical protein